MSKMVKVYAKTNEHGEIIGIGSSIFLLDTTDYILIDEGIGDKYAHAQNQYLANGIVDEQGRYNYKLVGSEVVEIYDKPIIELKPQVTTEERLDALESAMLELLLGGE